MERHIGPVIAAGSLLYIAVALFVVARGNQATALAILSESGSLDVALGVAVRGIPFALALIVLVMSVRPWARYRETHHALVVLAQVVLIVIADWITVSVVAAVVILNRFVLPWVHRRFTPPRNRTMDERIASLLGTILLLLMPGPWMPAQQVSKDDGSVVVGYMLNSEKDPIPILEYDSRLVVFVPSVAVSDRKICVTGSERSTIPQLIGLMSRRPSYDHCSDS